MLFDYLAVKILSAALNGLTLTHNQHFYCLYYLGSFRTENKSYLHGKVCKNYHYCENVASKAYRS